MAATTLHDVRDALQTGQRQQALQYLELILDENPSADAWFLSAELALDADRHRAEENLRHALALDPAHGDSLTLLARLNTGQTVAFTDIAQEPATNNRQTQFSRMRAMAITLAAVMGALAIAALLLKIVSPASAGNQWAGSPAASVNLYQPDVVFANFTESSLPLSNVEQTDSLAVHKHTLTFAVPDADNHGPYPVEVIVYDSVEALDSDLATREALVRTSQIHITGNVLFAYDKLLRGEAVERQMLYLFESIANQ